MPTKEVKANVQGGFNNEVKIVLISCQIERPKVDLYNDLHQGAIEAALGGCLALKAGKDSFNCEASL
jgi:hypothetical protein